MARRPVTVLFGYLAVRKVDPGDAWAAARASDPPWLVPAFAALAVAVVLRAVRWRSLLARQARPPLRDVLGALLVGYFFNSILPLRAGEAARVLALHRSSGRPRAELAATVVVERGFDLVALAALLVAASPWLPQVSWARAAGIVGGALLVAVVAAAVAVRVWHDRPFRALLRPLALLPFVSDERVGAASLNLVGGLEAFRRPAVAATAAAWTVLSWLALGLSTWFVLVAFHLHLSPLAGLLVVIAINLALVLPSSPAAVGVFEAATLVALATYGVPTSEAFPAAVVLHLVNLVPYLVVGGVVVQRAHGPRFRLPRPD